MANHTYEGGGVPYRRGYDTAAADHQILTYKDVYRKKGYTYKKALEMSNNYTKASMMDETSGICGL